MDIIGKVDLMVTIAHKSLGSMMTKYIYSNDIMQVHTDLYKRLFMDESINSIIIFQHILELYKPMLELDSNDLKYFLENNDTWDAIILSNYDLEETFPVKDFPNMFKLPKFVPYPTNKVLMVSRRMLDKIGIVKKPLEVYVYGKHIFKAPDRPEKTDRYVINQIVKLFVKDNKLQYAWKPI